MRTISIAHRDHRGTVLYTVYETVEQLLAQEPDAKIVHTLQEAERGCYVVSANGWVVPLLAISRMQDKYIRRTKGLERRCTHRKTLYDYVVFHFPKDRKCFRADKLEKAVFNYTPRTMDGLAGEGKRDRTYELSARKLYWARLVSQGWDIKLALREVFPQARNPNTLLKKLLNDDKLIHLISANFKGGFLLQSLMKEGISAETIVHTLATMIREPDGNFADRRWALGIVFKIFQSE